jgi:hypothetical protein
MPPRKNGQLTPREESFCQWYVYLGNGAEAARKAGYSPHSAGVIGTENLSKPALQARIAELRETVRQEAKVEQDEIIATLVRQMRGDLVQVLSADGGFDLNDVRRRGVGRLLKKLKVTQFGVVEPPTDPAEADESEKPAKRVRVKKPRVFRTVYEYEIHDPQAAASKLAQIFGLEQSPRLNDADAEREREADAENRRWAEGQLARLMERRGITDRAEGVALCREEAPTVAQWLS